MMAMLFGAGGALAHAAPFSYLDINLHDGVADGTLTVHVLDPAHELGVSPADRLYDPAVMQANFKAATQDLNRGLFLSSAGRELTPQWTGVTPLPSQQQ